MGLITVVISLLVGFGVLTPEQTGDVTEYGTSIVEAVAGVVTGVTGLIAVFAAKDSVE